MFSLATRSGRAARRAFVYTLLVHLFVSGAIVTGHESMSARGEAAAFPWWEQFLLFPATLGLGWFDPIVVQWLASSAIWAGGAALLARRLVNSFCPDKIES
jgi:hypothetical protein